MNRPLAEKTLKVDFFKDALKKALQGNLSINKKAAINQIEAMLGLRRIPERIRASREGTNNASTRLVSQRADHEDVKFAIALVDRSRERAFAK